MSFRVVWLNDALEALAASYLYARRKNRDPEEITRAMAAIDRELETRPTTAGESRYGTNRILIENPLTIFFEVHHDEQVVVVTALRYRVRRGTNS
jgi:hypothetical protein